MKKLILTAILATGTLFAGVTDAEAGKCRKSCNPCCKAKSVCCKPFAKIFPGRVKKSTEKVDEQCFYKTVCVNGCTKKVLYVKTIYKDTFCNGRTKYWSVTAKG